jgi:uncharacterized membrane protein YraQ (UPF0718 family)
MSSRNLFLLIGSVAVAVIGVVLIGLVFVVLQFPLAVMTALLIGLVVRVVISRERAKENRFEWQFIYQDERWSWEQRENWKVVNRSICSFESKTHCIENAREHGYSSFFCRCREIIHVAAKQAATRPPYVADASK